MLARGTTSRSKEEIGALLANVGAERHYVTTPTHVGIEADGMARDLPVILDVLADELRRPAFSAAELAKAKAELENEVLRADDSTSARAQERLAQLAYAPDHPYYPVGRAAKLQGLGALGVADLRDFHRARYVGAGAILADRRRRRRQGRDRAGERSSSATCRPARRRRSTASRAPPRPTRRRAKR
jgi:zinc protease